MNILIAEDEQDIRNLLELHLLKEGYTVFKAVNGLEALEILKKEHIHLALLDVMMDGIDGFNLLKMLREWSQIPVIFLTAKIEDDDKILGLGLGADDYVTKPFNMDVLVALLDNKVKFVINSEKSEVYRFGNMEHHPNIHTLFRDGKKIELTILENRILLYFLRNSNKVINRDELMLVVWGYNSDVNTRTLDMHIVRLRKKIELNLDNPQLLQTVRGVGYRFNAG